VAKTHGLPRVAARTGLGAPAAVKAAEPAEHLRDPCPVSAEGSRIDLGKDQQMLGRSSAVLLLHRYELRGAWVPVRTWPGHRNRPEKRASSRRRTILRGGERGRCRPYSGRRKPPLVDAQTLRMPGQIGWYVSRAG
jgi:hypothetical protein